MAGALETLCGQAYGAEQCKKLRIYTNAAIISYSGLYPNIYPMDVHRQITNTLRPRSNSLTYSSQILRMPHPSPVCIHYASTTSSLLPDSEPDPSISL